MTKCGHRRRDCWLTGSGESPPGPRLFLASSVSDTVVPDQRCRSYAVKVAPARRAQEAIVGPLLYGALFPRALSSIRRSHLSSACLTSRSPRGCNTEAEVTRLTFRLAVRHMWQLSGRCWTGIEACSLASVCVRHHETTEDPPRVGQNERNACAARSN